MHRGRVYFNGCEWIWELLCAGRSLLASLPVCSHGNPSWFCSPQRWGCDDMMGLTDGDGAGNPLGPHPLCWAGGTAMPAMLGDIGAQWGLFTHQAVPVLLPAMGTALLCDPLSFLDPVAVLCGSVAKASCRG